MPTLGNIRTLSFKIYNTKFLVFLSFWMSKIVCFRRPLHQQKQNVNISYHIAPPGGLIKYQIATYLCCNPQDAFHKVEDSSWEGQSLLQCSNSVLTIQALFHGQHNFSLSPSLLQCSNSLLTIQVLFHGHYDLSLSHSLLQCSNSVVTI